VGALAEQEPEPALSINFCEIIEANSGFYKIGGGKERSFVMNTVISKVGTFTKLIVAAFFAFASQSNAVAQQDLGEVVAMSECSLYPPISGQDICMTAIVPLQIRAVAISRSKLAKRARNAPRRSRRLRRKIISDADGHLTARRRKLPRGDYRIRLRRVSANGKDFPVSELTVSSQSFSVSKNSPQFILIHHKDRFQGPISVAY
jgi:hypothetical protein